MKEKYVIGVDFGGTRTKMGLVDIHTGKVIESAVIGTEKTDEKKFLKKFCNELNHLIEKKYVDRKDISGVGISIGSYVFTGQGIVDSMCGFIGLPDQYPMKQVFEEQLGIPCKVENDAKLIGYAESVFGAGRGYGRVLTITLGTGVGIGLMVNGRPSAPDAYTHLAGHIKVRQGNEIPCLDKYKCYCEIKGCLESTCSGTALELMAGDLYGADTSNKVLFDKAEGGDAKAIYLIKKYLDYLLIGLNQYVYVFAPDMFVLGGGVSKRLDMWLEYIEKGLKATIHSKYSPDIAIAELKEDGGILGAACLFTDEYDKNEETV